VPAQFRKIAPNSHFLSNNMVTPIHLLEYAMSEFLKLKAVSADISIGGSTIRKMVAKGEFPKPVTIGGCNRWVASEIAAWKERQIAERDAANVGEGAK
jgi:prophage regulatory protein